MPNQPTREEIVKTVRGFVGTPYQAGGQNNYGLDCVGLLTRTCDLLGIHYHKPKVHSQTPSRNFEKMLDRQLGVIDGDNAKPGDWLLYWMQSRGLGQHVACVVESNPLTIVHADRQIKKVVEVPETPNLRMQRMKGYSFLWLLSH